MKITWSDLLSLTFFDLILIGVYGAFAMLLAPLTGYVLLTWVLVMTIAVIHLYFCCFSPLSIVLHGIRSTRMDRDREQVIYNKLVVWIPSLRTLQVHIVEDVSVNLTIFRSHSTVHLLITDRFIEKLSGVHAESALCYMAQIASHRRFYTHSVIMVLAVLLERLKVTSILAASVIHSFIPAPEDKIWDTKAAAIHGADTYCEIFKVIIQCMYKSSALPSALSVISFSDISHGPLTYESMYAVHLAEMIRKNLLIP
ncbi:MAG: hypothetical protein WCJ70_02370 [bacterium]